MKAAESALRRPSTIQMLFTRITPNAQNTGSVDGGFSEDLTGSGNSDRNLSENKASTERALKAKRWSK